MIKRKKTRVIKVGPVKIGGNYPIVVQSMCNTDTRNVKATVKQIKQLKEAGCEIIRVAVPDMTAAKALGKIKKQIKIPLVADIHFDYKLALEAISQEVDKIRINPGNIGSKDKTKAVVQACKKAGIPIRIGVNLGSVKPELLQKYGKKGVPFIMVKSAEEHIKILEDLNFYNIAVSLKASDVPRTVEANRLFSKKYDYPIHLGITEAGLAWQGTIKSAVGFGILLEDGIGDTIRVSLTGDPIEEIKVGWQILKSLKLRSFGPELISCPTCGRTEIDLEKLAKKVDEFLKTIKEPITVAVMGCVVNGPGEAREADVGIAGGKAMGALFVKGRVVKTVKEKDMFSELKKLINRVVREKN